MTDAMGKSDVCYEIKQAELLINVYIIERSTTMSLDSF